MIKPKKWSADTHNTLIREVHQDVTIDLQHTDCMLQGYFRVEERKARPPIYKRYMLSIMTRMSWLRNKFRTLKQTSTQAIRNADGSEKAAHLRDKVTATLLNHNSPDFTPERVAEIQRQLDEIDTAAAELHRLHGGFEALGSKSAELRSMLHHDRARLDEKVEKDGVPRPDAVRNVRATRSRRLDIQAMVFRDTARMEDSSLRLLVYGWMNMVQKYLYEHTLGNVARGVLKQRRARARDEYLRLLARAYVEYQVLSDKVEPEGDEHFEELVDDTMEWIEDEINNDPDVPSKKEDMVRLVNKLASKRAREQQTEVG